MTEDELAAMVHLQWFHENLGAFGQLQGKQPQTLAHALADSPAGLIGWNGQLFGDAVDIEFAFINQVLLVHRYLGVIGAVLLRERARGRADWTDHCVHRICLLRRRLHADPPVRQL